MNEKVAIKSLEIQSEFLNKNPGQVRKNYITIGVFTLLVLIILGGFIGYLLYIGKDDIVKYILLSVSHLITALCGYFAGKKGLQKLNADNNSNTFESYEEISNPS